MSTLEGSGQKLLPGIRPACAEIPRLTRAIELCKDRIVAKCEALGIPQNDTRCRGPVYRADMAAGWGRRWEPGEETCPLQYLEGIRRELLLRELALAEESFDPTERFADTMQRMDAHTQIAGRSVLPLASHLEQVQDTPTEVLMGQSVTA